MHRYLMAVLLAIGLVGGPTTSIAQRQFATKQEQTLSAKQVFQEFSSRVVLLKTEVGGQPLGLASGVILLSDGYVATNAHVVDGAEVLQVVLSESGDNSKNAELRYYNAEADIAILKIDAKGLPAFDAGIGALPLVGERVFAIGNPRGLEHTITEGIVSGIRELDGRNLIQHSAAISPGSSGGALISEKGTLLGINQFLLKESQNLNFAIPVSALLDALAKATEEPLPFPRDPAHADPRFAALFAFMGKDYIRAIELAKAASAAPEFAQESYCIIGMANYELGKREDAETYLRQTVILSSDDNAYKQTARYYLIRLGYQRFTEDSRNASMRSKLVGMIQDFLKSDKRTIFIVDQDEASRTWAKGYLSQLRDISGEWTDENGELSGTGRSNFVRISKAADGTFSLWAVFSSSSQEREKIGITLIKFGKLEEENGTFTGRLIFIASYDSDVNNYWKQDFKITLRLSEDFSRLTGTASYWPGQGRGALAELFQKIMPPKDGAVSLARR